MFFFRRRRPKSSQRPLGVEFLEDRSVPAAFLGGVSIAVGDVNGDGYTDTVVGSGAASGTAANVRVISGANGQVLRSFNPFGTQFTGGVQVALGDFNADGYQDIVCGAGPGAAAQVNIFSGKDGKLIKGFVAINGSLLTGVNVATGDFNGDGQADIAVSARAGSKPWVSVYDGKSFASITTFFAFAEGFRGGVSIAMGDMVGTPAEEIICGAQTGGPSQINMFNKSSTNPVGSRLAFAAGYTGGVNVSTMHYNDSAYADLVVASGAGAPAQAVIFNGFSGLAVTSYGGKASSPIGGFNLATGQFQGASDFSTTSEGKTVVATNQQLVLTSTAGNGDFLQIYNPANKQTLASFSPFTGTPPKALGNQNLLNPLFNTGPSVADPIGNQTIYEGGQPQTFNLNSSFSDRSTTHSLVQLLTTQGVINMELIDPLTPATVANLINYVNNGAYTNMINHRLALSNGTKFVLQGGGFTFTNPNGTTGTITAIPTNSPVVNEPGISNTYGTIAMAKLGGDPNSATSQFFFNLGDNTANLDNQNGGFTVFSIVTGSGMDVVQAYSAYPVVNKSSTNSALNELPLTGDTGANFPANAKDANFSFVKSATTLQQGTPLTFSILSNSNPSVVTPTIVNGKLTLTPIAGSSGSSTITIKATNKDGKTVLQTFTVNAVEGVAPTITSADHTTFNAGTAGTFTVTSTATPAATYSVSSGTLPTGVTLNATTGVLSSTTSAVAGVYTFTISASNGVGTAATQPFTLTIAKAPTITSAASTTFVQGSPSTFNVTSTGTPAATYSVSSGTLPNGVTLNPTTGVLSSTADAALGTYNFTISASNGVGSPATQPFTLTIAQAAAPVFTSNNTASFTQGTAGSFTFTATGTPAPTYSVTSGTLPAGVSLNATTGVLSSTTAAVAGVYTFTVSASNGVGTPANMPFTLNINSAPAITSANNTKFAQGIAGSFNVTSTGTPAATYSVTSGTLPAGVTLDSTTGLLSSTVNAAVGTYVFTISASNGVGTAATQSFTLTIAAQAAPVFTSAASASFASGTSSTFTFVATGNPKPTYTVTSGSLPAGVALNSTTGVLIISNTAAAGTYNFSVTAANGVSPSAVQPFTLTLT